MVDSKDPAREAWALLWEIMQANKPRFMALAQELGLSPVQLHALRLIDADDEVQMSSLAGKLFCDNSNVTGIVDRLEARGLIRRRPAEHDRRVKLLGLTPEGERVRSTAISADVAAAAGDRGAAGRAQAGPPRRAAGRRAETGRDHGRDGPFP